MLAYVYEKSRKKSEKKEGKRRGAHIFALLKNKSATPTSLLLIKRSGTPPSLLILGVALKSGAQKSAALVHIEYLLLFFFRKANLKASKQIFDILSFKFNTSKSMSY